MYVCTNVCVYVMCLSMTSSLPLSFVITFFSPAMMVNWSTGISLRTHAHARTHTHAHPAKMSHRKTLVLLSVLN